VSKHDHEDNHQTIKETKGREGGKEKLRERIVNTYGTQLSGGWRREKRIMRENSPY
jgi:hypothetical protein